jgi:hypothetical protein
MSWSCDVCGLGRYDPHPQCAMIGALDRLTEKLDRLIVMLSRIEGLADE